ncbi:hypothetical protein [Halorussus marinus]|uniref:hypothetical protein n=1 Tax=Halorussus marinus TaxID=2505976 RepID=UPI00106EF9AA|nr:hypothetical protein [Halorussus marinus]
MATNGRTRSGQAIRATEANPSTVTDAVERDPTAESDAADREASDPEAVADRLRERGDSVRERELAAALDRLEAAGELSAAQRDAVDRLSARLADALVEQWASTVAAERVDPSVARDLLEP